MLHTKTFARSDKRELIALIVLIAILLLYGIGMALWIHYEFNRPLMTWKIHDLIGNYLAAEATKKIKRKLFKRDRG